MFKTITTLCALSFAIAAHAETPEPPVRKFDECLSRDQALLAGVRMANRGMGVMFDIDADKMPPFVKAWKARFRVKLVAEEAFAVLFPTQPRAAVVFVHDGKTCEVYGVLTADMKALFDAMPDARKPTAPSPSPDAPTAPIPTPAPTLMRPEGEGSL